MSISISLKSASVFISPPIEIPKDDRLFLRANVHNPDLITIFTSWKKRNGIYYSNTEIKENSTWIYVNSLHKTKGQK
jgi:hypothetical protein